MKKIIKISMMLAAFFMINMEATEAQKYGYISSEALLLEMPQVKQADANLQTMMTQFQKKGQEMVQALQAKEANALQKKERGELSPAEEQALLAELQAEGKKIQDFEAEAADKMQKKRLELLGPVQTQVQDAISAVAKENGYTMILEAGVLLFAEESADVSSLVKAKLGI